MSALVIAKSFPSGPYPPATQASALTGVAGAGLDSDLKAPMYYTYVLLSLKDGLHYIGYSNDLQSRIKQHMDGEVTATRDRRPLQLIYYEACTDKNKALAREKYFKTGFGRRFLKSRLA